MAEAVTAADGWSYERGALLLRFRRGEDRSAVTGERLEPVDPRLLPNKRLQAVIQRVLHMHGFGVGGGAAFRAGPLAECLFRRMGESDRARRLLPHLCCPITQASLHPLAVLRCTFSCLLVCCCDDEQSGQAACLLLRVTHNCCVRCEQDLMRDAVIARDGVTYERKALAAELLRTGASPVTLLPLPRAAPPVPNRHAQVLVAGLLRAHSFGRRALCFAAGSRAEHLYANGGGAAAVLAALQRPLLCALTKVGLLLHGCYPETPGSFLDSPLL